MKLSIIVPFHRGKHFLEDCLASIRDQGITDFETVLVLDHVTEDISEILEKYSDLNIKTVKLNKEEIKDRKFGSEEKARMLKGYCGAAAAKNAGIDAAEGEYIYFLDSDDYILNGTLPYLLKEAEEQQADFVYGRRNTTWNKRMVYLAYVEGHNDESNVINNDEDKEEPENYKKEKVEQEIISQYPGLDRERLRQMTEAYYNLLLSRKGFMNVTLTGVLVRRSFVESNGLRFNEKFIFFYDLGFMIRMLIMAKSFSMAEEA
ncbi:MAG TPA: glycosyltransferase family A protein, partial [Mobilitalea sp.]|nr:glycosyltransferase family A protein [Mobilitalea sp.]